MWIWPSTFVFAVTCLTHVSNLRKIGQKLWSLSRTKYLSVRTHTQTLKWFYKTYLPNAMNYIGQMKMEHHNLWKHHVNTLQTSLGPWDFFACKVWFIGPVGVSPAYYRRKQCSKRWKLYINFSQGSAAALCRWGGQTNNFCVAYFLNILCAKMPNIVEIVHVYLHV